MKFSLKTLILLTLAMLLLVGAGCAKKKVVDTSEEVARPAQTDDAAMAAQRAAEQEALRQRQLEEERARREAEEQARMAANSPEVVREVANMIHFDFDSFELKPEARDILQAKSQVLKANPSLNIVIEGYCDERGTEEYNLALGERRARAAYEFLVLLGVDPSRMSIVSYGEEDPIDPAHTEAAWAKNRRDQFKIN